MAAEDAYYRSSTQYRLWSFTPQALRDLRSATNSLAAARVKAAFEKLHDASTILKEGAQPETVATGTAAATTEKSSEKIVDCLTADEELKLVRYYCGTLLKMGDEFGMPAEAKVCCYMVFYFLYLANHISQLLMLKCIFYAAFQYARDQELTPALGHRCAVL